jgi:hypothetical protein
MNQTVLADMTQKILEQMPPSTRFSDPDYQVIAKHRQLLLSLEVQVVQGFYDTLFAHAPTKAIFHDGERPAREQSLRDWWRRTLKGPFDDEYWTWQTFVGLIHIKRGVKNPMMIAMWGWALTTLRQLLQTELSNDELKELMESLERLAATVQSLTAESYLENYLAALTKSTGFSPVLLDRFVQSEVDELLRAARR